MTVFILTNNSYCSLLFESVLNRYGINIKIYSNYEELKKSIKQTNEILAILLDLPNPKLRELRYWIELLKLTPVPVLILSSDKEDPERILLRQKTTLILGQPLVHFFKNLHLNKIEDGQRNLIGDIIRLSPDVIFNLAKQCIVKSDENLDLSSMEYKLLYILVYNLGCTLSADKLMDWVNLYSISSLYVHIANLRKKIESDPKSPNILLTDKGKGYTINMNNVQFINESSSSLFSQQNKFE
ncbi:hypothetical protein CAI16_17005 [Virgibacillus dokdonensis]|uniref:OmpR/PhoB-type domain-containing protein n=1 Tax=Virgibacillus dokdonensis TaxID=302167 RepID=A0A3E0WIE7_9BACI|nr:winged helix-turn-helix domain-containing protein [Virgibacillus dokdonensis]RFA32760.1 hypothetical protein CAI16_17005 [Virgibacillus dokdonensis]